MKEIIEKLIKNKKTISTMESCTGGYIANAITNIEGASEVFKFSAITYSNDFKIKMGIKKETIDKYSVYSEEVSKEMSLNICKYTDSDYGIGITGKLNRRDINNLSGDNDLVYISIYDKVNRKYYNEMIRCHKQKREDNKQLILDKVIEIFKIIL